MRVQIMAGRMILAALLMACNKPTHNEAQAARDRTQAVSDQAASPVSLGQMGKATVSQREAPASETARADEWSGAVPFDATARLIVRTGQASIEVDSLQPSMTELRRLVQR